MSHKCERSPPEQDETDKALPELSNGRNLGKLQFLVSITICLLTSLCETERDETLYFNFFQPRLTDQKFKSARAPSCLRPSALSEPVHRL